ncbi:hypothetical protein KAI52_04130 [Candidatus Parcubacteria bacterium]|nr:hypothetical protein [Candidatus Parcubacteria bacterium]
MKQNNKKKEQAFKKWFVDMVYDNMAMEDEAVLTKKEIRDRSKMQMNNLVKEGVHKKIIFPKKYA